MTERKRYNVGAVKIPHADRDVAHAVLSGDDPRGFMDIIGADTPDEHDTFPVGANVTYSVELTEEEAERFRAASNARYVEEDQQASPMMQIPTEATMTWMDAPSPYTTTWHGRDVPVAVLDSGTTAAVRNYMGHTLLARAVFGSDPSPAEVHPGQEHGCLVAANAVPAGGRFFDALITTPGTTLPASYSAMAAAMTWAADQGAKIANLSYGGAPPASVLTDAITYMAGLGAHLYAAAGNDNSTTLVYPAAYSATYPNVHSVIAFDQHTGARWPGSSHAAWASGCAPGYNVTSLNTVAAPVAWYGTSAASPHAARLCALLCTGGRFTAAQAAAALDTYTRDTGYPAVEQGGGAFSLSRALTGLDPSLATPYYGSVLDRVTDGQSAGVSAFLNGVAEEIDKRGEGVLIRCLVPGTAQPDIDYYVIFDGVDFDTLGGSWSPDLNYTITIRETGTYLLYLQMRWGAFGTTGGYASGSRHARIMIGGTDPATQSIGVDRKPFSLDGEGVTNIVEATAKLTEGTQVFAGVRQTGSGPIQSSDQSFGGSFLFVFRIGQ